MEALQAVLPIPEHSQWIVMFENGPGIKLPLEKLARILHDVGVFTIDFVVHETELPDGSRMEVPYYFFTLCQELKERNGTAFFQFPIHHFGWKASATEPIDEESLPEMP